MLLLQNQCPSITEHIPRERLCDAVAVVSIACLLLWLCLSRQSCRTSEAETEPWDRSLELWLDMKALRYKIRCLAYPRSYKEAVWSPRLLFSASEAQGTAHICDATSAGLLWEGWWSLLEIQRVGNVCSSLCRVLSAHLPFVYIFPWRSVLEYVSRCCAAALGTYQA